MNLNNNKTIAFFNAFFLPHLGGVERYTYNLGKMLIEQGYNVIVITTNHTGELNERENLEGIEIYRLPTINFWKNRYPFFEKNHNFEKLLEKIKSIKIDTYVVNTRLYQMSLLGCRAADENGKEAIVIEHGTTYLTFGNKILDFFLNNVERLLIKRVKNYTTRFYGVSKQAANWLKEFNINSEGVLYNAVDEKDFERFSKRKNENRITLNFVGRFQAKFKGIETLLSAFEKLSREYDNVELFLAGDGPILEAMRKKYSQERINFLGRVSHEEVLKLNSKSDIFVLLSKIEGFSTSMIEAAMLKNVVITTDVGGARELIPTEEYGYIIENDEVKLLETLKKIISDKEIMRKTQEKVSLRVLQNFTWTQTAKRLVEVIEGDS
ncbi:MAG TPA: glycosyltransferase family 4 protein [Lactovum miscens]|uniref:glycosyltransferase family 4 protein n=1 Tax=Lactovum miscens TaxID=190387 RepID=UPI002ED88EAA